MPKDIEREIESLYRKLYSELDCFRQNNRFYSIRELMRRNAVSRRIVEKALKRLELEGEISIEPTCGIFVSAKRSRNSFAIASVHCDWPAEYWVNLDSALELEPTHLSAYSLTLEEGTALAERTALSVPSDDLSAEMWEFIGSYTAEILPRYEISNYAKRDDECRHNQAVWHGERYFGFGPAACSFDGVRRWTEPASLNGWLAGDPAEEDLIPRETRLAEIFMMGLRTVLGWRVSEFERVTGNSLACLEDKIERLVNSGLLLREGEVIRATEKGLPFWNVIAEELL